MNVTIQQGGIQSVAADAIIINLFRGVTEPKGATGVVDKALGERMSGLFCTDDALADRLRGAGARVGEPLWPLPLDPA